MTKPHDDLEAQLRRWCEAPLWQPGPATFFVCYGRGALARLLGLSTRDLLIDTLTRIDLEQACVGGTCYVDPRHSNFDDASPERGDCPPDRVAEMLRQIGLCTALFHAAGSPSLPACLRDGEWELIECATVCPAPVRAGDVLTLNARAIRADGASVRCATQALRGETGCAAAVIEMKRAAGP